MLTMLELRDVKAADEGMLHTWRNLPEVAKYMYSDHQIDAAEHAHWFHSAMNDPTRKYWIIRSDAEDVGLANLYAIDRTHSRCSWAFYLASSRVRGRGVGSFVEYRVLEHVFDTLELNRLTCEVIASNLAVVIMHESFGFRREGYWRSHVKKSDSYTDVIQLAILRQEWQQLKPGIVEKLRGKGLL